MAAAGFGPCLTMTVGFRRAAPPVFLLLPMASILVNAQYSASKCTCAVVCRRRPLRLPASGVLSPARLRFAAKCPRGPARNLQADHEWAAHSRENASGQWPLYWDRTSPIVLLGITPSTVLYCTLLATWSPVTIQYTRKQPSVRPPVIIVDTPRYAARIKYRERRIVGPNLSARVASVRGLVLGLVWAIQIAQSIIDSW
ncbi:hypothetical protein DM02DRAFT_634246 [Periconia macrospinosa]|uniref:Uncharacterized protein n=1 Tax=Periconia macrospinosa TaxID=97972 RepID=A0A2V1D9E0_9PLEO|nr:hypothetical protein DM02DRAFT_634246 [Periconia macrospinosa]